MKQKLSTKILLSLILITCSNFCKGQTVFADTSGTTAYLGTSFLYCDGIQWTENYKQDSIVGITVVGDTMQAIRKLLVFVLQEKAKADNAEMLLSMMNLDYLNGLFKRREFGYYLKEYRKTIARNKKARLADYPKLIRYIMGS